MIEQRIQELGKEASELTRVRDSLIAQLKEIDVRLTQITGAIVELKKINESINNQEKEGEK